MEHPTLVAAAPARELDVIIVPLYVAVDYYLIVHDIKTTQLGYDRASELSITMDTDAVQGTAGSLAQMMGLLTDHTLSQSSMWRYSDAMVPASAVCGMAARLELNGTVDSECISCCSASCMHLSIHACA